MQFLIFDPKELNVFAAVGTFMFYLTALLQLAELSSSLFASFKLAGVD